MNIYNKVIKKNNLIIDNYINSKKIVYKHNNHHDSPNKNIIFLCPALNSPSGGVIVIHNQSCTINQINYKNLKSSILFPYKLNFNSTWFETEAKYKRDLQLSGKTDFIIIPEIYAARHAQALCSIGVSYAINVQNGYLIDFESTYSNSNFDEIKYAYEKADFIIGISDDTIDNIKMTFPNCASKVIKSYYIIDKAKFKPFHLKKNVISFMPRKLARHTELLTFMIKQSLPSHWHFEILDNISENAVYEKLSDTKIFLSFSELEGLAMPPVMAALSGAHVIGYTGEGCKEYFHLPCFTEINSGDIKSFVKELFKYINEMDAGRYVVNESDLSELKDRFSHKTQMHYLENLAKKIDDILDAKSALIKNSA